MIKKLVIILFLVYLPFVKAQNFTQAVGLRGGLTSGITYRIHVNEELAHEFMLKLNANELNVVVLRVFYQENAFGYSPKLVLFKGYGAHAGYKYRDQYNAFFRDIHLERKMFYPVLGFDAYLGLEYRIEEFPVIFGLDCKPFFEFSPKQIYRLYLPDIAFTIKYRF